MDFKLPEKSIFSKKMPRYPNVWFYVNSSVVCEYREVVYLIARGLEKYCRIVDDFDQSYRLRSLLFGCPEGSDMQARYKGLQPYTDLSNPPLSHDHQLHVRYYFSDLVRNKTERVKLNIDGRNWSFSRLALSVHYEVTTENKNHPYVESCPICGRVGEYNIRIDRNKLDKDMCRKIHDPLGVEFFLRGTIRGRTVYDNRGRKVGSIEDMKKDCNLDTYIIDPRREEMNTPKIGCVLIRQIKCIEEISKK